MNLVNHEPIIRVFVNGFQITFPNRYGRSQRLKSSPSLQNGYCSWRKSHEKRA